MSDDLPPGFVMRGTRDEDVPAGFKVRKKAGPKANLTTEEVNKDVAYSALNVPRDILEGTIALPSMAEDFKAAAIRKGKEWTSPDSLTGRAIRGFESISDAANKAVPIRDYLPSEQDVQSVTTPIIRKGAENFAKANNLGPPPKEITDPYESKTGIGKGIRLGLNMAVPMVGMARAAGEAKNARKIFKTVDELQDAKNAAYEEAKQKAPDVFPNEYNSMAKDVKKTADGLPIDRFPQAQHANHRIQEAVYNGPPSEQQQWYNAFGGNPPPKPKPVDFNEIEDIRKGLVKAERKGGPGSEEGFVYGKMRQAIDDGLAKVGANSPHYKLAREANVIYKRAEKLDNLIQDATDLAKSRGTNEMDEIRKALFRKTQRSSPGDVKWMNDFPPEVQTMIREASLAPKKFEKLLGVLSKDRTIAWGAMGILAEGTETGAKAAIVARFLSSIARYAKGRMGGLSPKMLEELQRRTQGLGKAPGIDKWDHLRQKGSRIGGAAVGQSPDDPNAPVRPLGSFLPTDRDEVPGLTSTMGIRG